MVKRKGVNGCVCCLLQNIVSDIHEEGQRTTIQIFISSPGQVKLTRRSLVSVPLSTPPLNSKYSPHPSVPVFIPPCEPPTLNCRPTSPTHPAQYDACTRIHSSQTALPFHLQSHSSVDTSAEGPLHGNSRVLIG